MEKKEIQVLALNNSESSIGNFALVLEELESKKRMVIIIGPFEAQAIAVHMERMKLARPLTHDVLKNTILAFGAEVQEIIIHTVIDNMFHAQIIVKDKNNEVLKLDARASDAIALGIRFDCPMYATEMVLEQSFIEEDNNIANFMKGSLSEYSLEELEALLKSILAKEDYESAGRIRDMIKRRKK